jgi:hypothetical protein
MIALMMEAASTSEMSVNLYQTTRRNNTEDSRLQLLRGLHLYKHFYKTSIIKMETVCSSETLVINKMTTRCHKP